MVEVSELREEAPPLEVEKTPVTAPSSAPSPDAQRRERPAGSVSPAAAPEKPGSAELQSVTTQPFRVRLVAALVAISIILLFLFLPGLIVDYLSDYIWLPVHGSPLASRIANDIVMLLLALGAIALLRRYAWGDFGLRMPKWPTYVPSALFFGILFGFVMAFVDYAPDILKRAPPHGFEPRQLNIAGWLFYYGVVAGPAWEIPFRGLLLTYLFWAMPGVVGWRGFRMSGAGIYVAALFAVPWAFYNAVAQSFLIGFGEGLYVFVGSCALAYWFERSKSVVAPIVGHAAAACTWQALVFAMIFAWR